MISNKKQFLLNVAAFIGSIMMIIFISAAITMLGIAAHLISENDKDRLVLTNKNRIVLEGVISNSSQDEIGFQVQDKVKDISRNTDILLIQFEKDGYRMNKLSSSNNDWDLFDDKARFKEKILTSDYFEIR